jgi:hypothetical protein
MKTKNIFIALGWFLSLILSGCGSSGGPGPRTWIDSPLDGSTLPLEPVIVRSHASSMSGTASVALYVNNDQVRVDNVTDPTASLVEISQVWEPTEPGDYALQVIATDHEGNPGRSNFVSIHIGEMEEVSPSPTNTETPPSESADPTETSEPTLTPTSEPQPSAMIGDSLCWVGPGSPYDVISNVTAGTTVEIIGIGDKQGWFVIKNPLYSVPCWVPENKVAVDPQIALSILEVFPVPLLVLPTDTSAPAPPPPPPPAPSPPAAPNQLVANTTTCNSSDYAVTIQWNDNSNNETGYRVYRDGGNIATLGAGATSYVDHPPYSGPHTYLVEAYNGAGSAPSNSSPDQGCVY